MHCFTDEQGREWKLALNYAALKRFKAAGVDAIGFIANETGDLEMLVRILWTWLEPQINERGVDEEAFAEMLYGKTIAAAWEALRDEVLDFLSHTNPPLAAALRKAKVAASLLMEKAAEAADSISLPSSLSSTSA